MKSTGNVVLRQTSAISDFTLLLFGGEVVPGVAPGTLEMAGGLIKFATEPRTAALILHLRAALQGLIQKKVCVVATRAKGSSRKKGAESLPTVANQLCIL